MRLALRQLDLRRHGGEGHRSRGEVFFNEHWANINVILFVWTGGLEANDIGGWHR